MTQEYIKSLFDYDSDKGILTYKVNRGGNAKAGQEAGWTWSVGNKRYKHIKIDGKSYRYHRLVWMYMYGKFPNDQIDHINGDTLDNRIENLRDVTSIENSKNRGIQSNNTSGYSGINQLPSGNWRVRINVNKKRINIGTFDSFDEAYKARKQAEVDYNYHKNHGRINEQHT